jgi:disulfide oxidoreductase YuzD
VDFTNIARQVYWLHEPTTAINYRTLYEQYETFTDANISLLRSYLLQIEQRCFMYQQYSLFDESRTYWQIAVYASVLEAMIGHANNCLGSVTMCPICNKYLQPHRQKSEKEWRESYLTPLIPDQAIRNEYLDIINTAYNEIRHPIAHAGVMPIPQYLSPLTGTTEVYDTSRAIEQFPIDKSALSSLVISVKDITRY